MLPELLTMVLAVGAAPQPQASSPALKRIELPKLIDGPPPLKPLSAQMPVVRPVVLSTALTPAPQSLDIPRLKQAPNLMSSMPTLPLLPASTRPVLDPKVPPNGCGTDHGWIANAKLLPQTAGGANFRPACNDHDRCYSTPFASKKACDDQFYLDMKQRCETRAFDDRQFCRAGAWIYYNAVKYGGNKAFYESQVNAILDSGPYPSLFGSSSPVDAKVADKLKYKLDGQFHLLPQPEVPQKLHLLNVDQNKSTLHPASLKPTGPTSK
jgi:hypothetical protein